MKTVCASLGITTPLINDVAPVSNIESRTIEINFADVTFDKKFNIQVDSPHI